MGRIWIRWRAPRPPSESHLNNQWFSKIAVWPVMALVPDQTSKGCEAAPISMTLMKSAAAKVEAVRIALEVMSFLLG